MKKKRYSSLFNEATKLNTYKAWVNPNNNYFYRWEADSKENSGDHDLKAQELLNLDMSSAFDKGYFRIDVNNHGLNIQSNREPSEKEFKCLQKCLSKYTNLSKIAYTMFEIKDVTGKGDYHTFPKQSFFLAKSFKELKDNGV
jgi:hypothetical protein